MNILRVRKRPVEVEAVVFDGSIDRAVHIAYWIRGMDGEAYWYEPAEGTAASLVIFTSEGRMEASPGDYVIRGVKGEFYPCKPDVFAQTYDIV